MTWLIEFWAQRARRSTATNPTAAPRGIAVQLGRGRRSTEHRMTSASRTYPAKQSTSGTSQQMRRRWLGGWRRTGLSAGRDRLRLRECTLAAGTRLLVITAVPARVRPADRAGSSRIHGAGCRGDEGRRAGAMACGRRRPQGTSVHPGVIEPDCSYRTMIVQQALYMFMSKSKSNRRASGGDCSYSPRTVRAVCPSALSRICPRGGPPTSAGKQYV